MRAAGIIDRMETPRGRLQSPWLGAWIVVATIAGGLLALWLLPAERFTALLSESGPVEQASNRAGEVCFAVESRYAPWTLLNGRTVAGRAREVFAQLGVWDTQDNSGVLLYLQLAERRVEIVADRGIAARVAPAQWQAVCDRFALDVRARGLDAAAAEAAVVACIEQLHDLIAAQFPAADDNPREFPDDPIIL